jgi:hypothetical protein
MSVGASEDCEAWYVAPPGAQNCCGMPYPQLALWATDRSLASRAGGAGNLTRFYRIFERFISTGVGGADVMPVAHSASCGYRGAIEIEPAKAGGISVGASDL